MEFLIGFPPEYLGVDQYQVIILLDHMTMSFLLCLSVCDVGLLDTTRFALLS